MIRICQSLAVCCVLSALAVAFAQDAKDEGKHTKDEDKILELINKARAEKKLPPFKANAILIKVARAHSANMNKQKKMDHVLDGKNPLERVDEAKYDYAEAAENLAFMPKTGNYPELIKAWLKSPTHGPHILGKCEETGIGIFLGDGAEENKGKKGYWITQLFGTQQKQ